MEYNYQTLKVDQVADQVLRVSLNNPAKINAMDNQMIADVWDITEKLKNEDRENSVVILTGEGEKGFCAGAVVDEVFAPEVVDKVDSLYHAQTLLGQTMINLRLMPQIVVCACFGACVGGGLCYALASDIRIITENTRLSAPFVKIKMGGADLGTSYFLPRIIGAGVSYDLLLSGRWMYAEEAMRLGFASEMVPADELDEAAMRKATELTRIDRTALQYTKEALNVGLDLNNLQACIWNEHRNQQLIFSKLWRNH